MDKRVKQQGNEFMDKLIRAALYFFLTATLMIGSYLECLNYLLYCERYTEAFKTLHFYGFRHFSKIKLQFIDLQGIDLQGANLQQAELREANLKYANLQGADLRIASLGKAINLECANLQKADLRGARLWGNLQEANLKGAHLQKARLICSSLQNANLVGANLQGASFLSVDLEGANLKGANLQNASLQDVASLYTEYTNLETNFCSVTVEQICECENIEGIRFLPKWFLSHVKRLNPKLMEWWSQAMVKEIDKTKKWPWVDNNGWTGRWIEAPTSQADKQGER